MEKATNDIIKEVCELDARLNILDARIPDIKAEEIGIFYGELCYLAEKANKQIEYLNGNGQSEDGCFNDTSTTEMYTHRQRQMCIRDSLLGA